MTTGTRRPSVRAAAPWLLGALLILGALLGVALATRGQSADISVEFADDSEAALVYAQCVRDNGYPEFPDPGPDGRISLSAGHGEGEHDRDDPTFVAAQEACSDLLPEGADHQDLGDPEYVEQMREFAQCMRDNGLPDFPDPDADGRIVLDHGEGGYGDARLNAAMETCYESVPGVAH